MDAWALHYHVTKRVRLVGGGDKRPCPLSQLASTQDKGTPKWGCSGALLGPFSLRDLNWVMIKGLMFLLFEKL